jgi:transcriptional regulator with XRE-family HTH domain
VVSERRAFGDRARRQRERRGVSLEAIAEATKVPASLFAGLERGDCSRWPGGLYSRAYLRAYAEAIGLDPAEALEDFGTAFADTVLPSAQGRPPARRAAAPALRLSMDDQPEVRHGQVLRRVALAGADAVIASLLAWLVHLLLDSGLWTTVGLALGFQVAGRILSDEPFVVWTYEKLLGKPKPVPGAGEDVSVTDPARTTA